MTVLDDKPGPALPALPRRPLPSIQRTLVYVVLLALLAAAIWSVIELQINIATFIDGFANAVDFIGRVFPLDFPPIGEIVSMTVETLAIVTVATTLSVALSIPIALFAARNTSTGPVARGIARTVIVFARAVPDLIFAIILFRIFGLGALPGILALGFHSVGMVAKLYADAIEDIDNGPQEALSANGAARGQRILSGVLPQIMPQIIATALHRFDVNLRTSVLLGYVGVGGIGLEISGAMRTLDYQRGMALALIVLILCVVIELVSGAIRARLLGTREVGGLVGFIDKVFNQRIDDPIRTRSGDYRLGAPWNGERVRRWFAIGSTAAIVALATLASDIDWANIIPSLLDMPAALALFFPPGTEGIMDQILEQLVVTIQIGLAATLLGLIISIPIGVFAARNVAANRTVSTLFRLLIVVVRGIPELILAIIFIVITGLGPVPGTLALAIGSIGLFSKLIADSLEETDTRVQTAIETVGATRAQVFFSSTIHQVMPAFIAHILYLLDVNFRSATLLGIVGAGGIGIVLLNASRVQQFEVVTTVLLLILAVVLFIEGLSVWIRSVIK